MADVTYIPDQQNQANNLLPWMLASQGGGFGFGGLNSITDLFGLAIVAQMFGWNGGGLGNMGGNAGAAAGFIANQMNNDSGRELLMNAIVSQGEASRTATQGLATMIGQDFNLVNGAIQSIQSGLSSLALQQAVSVPQLMNSIMAGDQSILTKLGECCCENRLAICQQTNAIQSAIAGVNENIAANRAAQQLSDCQQTYALTDTMNRGFLSLDNKIDALESNRKDREITALTAKVAQLESQNFTAGALGSALAPVNAALAALAREVDDIKCKQPNTVSVQYPNLAAVNMTPYVSGGFYQGGFNGYYGGGVPGFGYNGGYNF